MTLIYQRVKQGSVENPVFPYRMDKANSGKEHKDRPLQGPSSSNVPAQAVPRHFSYYRLINGRFKYVIVSQTY
jgi:hypothetical protein